MTIGSLKRGARQPPRDPADPLYVGIRATQDFTHLEILASDKDSKRVTSVELSEYNAWAAFGLLALFLGIKLPDTKACRSIQIWPPEYMKHHGGFKLTIGTGQEPGEKEE